MWNPKGLRLRVASKFAMTMDIQGIVLLMIRVITPDLPSASFGRHRQNVYMFTGVATIKIPLSSHRETKWLPGTY
jgi:hypothetical protein